MPWDGTELWIGDLTRRWRFDQHGASGGWDEGINLSTRVVSGGRALFCFRSQRLVEPSSALGPALSKQFAKGKRSLVCRNGVLACRRTLSFPPTELFAATSKTDSRALVCSTRAVNNSSRWIVRTRTSGMCVRPADQAVMRAGSATQAASIVSLDLKTRGFTVLRSSTNLQIDAAYFSAPRAVEFPTENGLTAHGFFYPPKNKDYRAPEAELPPLLVQIHGGPTSAASTAMSLSIQYWTSRGIAVLDVNYGGSTGFGRAYRERLNDNWGIVDVDDCCNGARYLAAQGEVDGNRLLITGGSAGGYTTLCALTFRDTFNAGASHYGVSDAEALAQETHKFESRYLDGLIGPYPERRETYVQRSPINYTDQLSCPVIFFQGLEDKVVPPNQAEMMVEALRQQGNSGRVSSV